MFNGFTALHYACYCGCLEVASILIHKEYYVHTRSLVDIDSPGIEVDFDGRFPLPVGSTALQIALLRRKVPILQMLV